MVEIYKMIFISEEMRIMNEVHIVRASTNRIEKIVILVNYRNLKIIDTIDNSNI